MYQENYRLPCFQLHVMFSLIISDHFRWVCYSYNIKIDQIYDGKIHYIWVFDVIKDISFTSQITRLAKHTPEALSHEFFIYGLVKKASIYWVTQLF